MAGNNEYSSGNQTPFPIHENRFDCLIFSADVASDRRPQHAQGLLYLPRLHLQTVRHKNDQKTSPEDGQGIQPAFRLSKESLARYTGHRNRRRWWWERFNGSPNSFEGSDDGISKLCPHQRDESNRSDSILNRKQSTKICSLFCLVVSR